MLDSNHLTHGSGNDFRYFLLGVDQVYNFHKAVINTRSDFRLHNESTNP